MDWLRSILIVITAFTVFYAGWTIGKIIRDDLSTETRVEVRLESPYPEFTCQEDELMVWVNRTEYLARCINLEEWEAMQ